MYASNDLSYAVAYHHINDLYREAATRRLLHPRLRRPRTPRRLSRVGRPWVTTAGTGTC